MQLMFTMTKKMDDGRTSNWRFLKVDEGYCAVGGNYKLLQYRSEFGMNKSRDWFASKGYTLVAA